MKPKKIYNPPLCRFHGRNPGRVKLFKSKDCPACTNGFARVPFWPWLVWNLTGRRKFLTVDELDREIWVPEFQLDHYWNAYRRRHGYE
jgi:hypothetical protein